jgi:hypothetical protein
MVRRFSEEDNHLDTFSKEEIEENVIYFYQLYQELCKQVTELQGEVKFLENASFKIS